jgi:dihydroxy-acid dehydratase
VGPIALVEDGDAIEIDEESRPLNLLVEPAVLGEEKKVGDWKGGGAAGKKGTSGKYAKLVRDASHGCITDTD